MKIIKYTRLAFIVGGVILLSACTRSLSHVDSHGKTDNPLFPDTIHAVRDEGSFVNLDNLMQMRKNMTKAEVYELIGIPHYNEGVFRVKEWDYIFHFAQPDDSILTCQYKVLFDSEMKTQSLLFHPSNCLEKIKLSTTAERTVVHKEINSSVLFDFNSHTLSTAGIRHINTLASELKSEKLINKHIVVTGYADRIGNPSKNMQLSQARADSVVKMLVQNGVPAAIIKSRGLGDAEPRTLCPGEKSPAVIDCLAPNRRITVDVVGLTSDK